MKVGDIIYTQKETLKVLEIYKSFNMLKVQDSKSKEFLIDRNFISKEPINDSFITVKI